MKQLFILSGSTPIPLLCLGKLYMIEMFMSRKGKIFKPHCVMSEERLCTCSFPIVPVDKSWKKNRFYFEKAYFSFPLVSCGIIIIKIWS